MTLSLDTFYNGKKNSNLYISCFRTSPPYYAYALHALDGIVLAVPWVATMHYGYKITPPDLVATMVATITCIQFVIGQSAQS